MTEPTSPLWQLCLSRWRGFFREPSALFWTFGFPLMLTLALGIAFRNRPPEPVFAAVEAGAGAESIRGALTRGGQIRATVMSAAEAQQALRTARVAIVVVPSEPRVYRYDPTQPESRLARLVVDDALQRADGRLDPRHVRDTLVTERGARYVDFLVPGLIGLGLMSSGLWGVGFVLVEMRTRKLIKRLVATPMRKSHFLLSFLITRAAFVVIEIPVILGFAWLTFGVTVRGSIALVVALGLLGAVTFASLGLLVASRAQNTQTAGGLMNLCSLPMFIFSGSFFNSSRFPDSIQPAVRALPLTALNDALRGVMNEGLGIAGIAVPVAILVFWTVVLLALSLRLFVWR